MLVNCRVTDLSTALRCSALRSSLGSAPAAAAGRAAASAASGASPPVSGGSRSTISCRSRRARVLLPLNSPAPAKMHASVPSVLDSYTATMNKLFWPFSCLQAFQ